MKVIIVSDTHGDHTTLRMALEREAPYDMLLHLGDVEGYADYIEDMAGCPTYIVAGNNDYFSDLPRERILKIGKSNIFMTHGHKYDVHFTLWDLRQAAIKKKCNVAMYGHTHVPRIEYGDIVVINPGSLSRPRQADRRATYIVMYVDDEGNAEFELKYVD
ncbi:MAG: metallophosphoesterase [Lachnospiraceae bacterium]|nr:metallophosphoesterase [Lachnospiraceae bacterium]